ncbi:MAG: amidase family protein, partial [Dehalococcoidia bacterium]
MALRLPSKDDLRKAASLNGLDPTEEEVEGFQSLTPGFFQLLETLDQMPVENPVLRQATRDPGKRPQPEDDPLNAILLRCSIKGPSSGRLAGVRVGLKDNISVAGVPMTCGSRVLSGYVPDVDATVVIRLLKEGAEIVATLNMDDFAWSGTGGTSAYGPVLNPHSRNHLAGGSSAGSAAALYYDDIDMT